MTMSKADYEMLAKAVHSHVAALGATLEGVDPKTKAVPGFKPYWMGVTRGAQELVVWLAAVMETHNPRFDRAKFLKAAGFEDIPAVVDDHDEPDGG